MSDAKLDQCVSDQAALKRSEGSFQHLRPIVIAIVSAPTFIVADQISQADTHSRDFDDAIAKARAKARKGRSRWHSC